MTVETPWIDFGEVYGWDELNPVQVEAAGLLSEGSDVVIAANSGAGKTAVAEMAIARALEAGGRAVYVSPLKALTREKRDAWGARAHPFAAAGVGIVTGAHKTDTGELERRRVVCCTSEMLDSRGRGEVPAWLSGAGVLVVDEVHLLGTEKRGPALEVGLMNFLHLNPACAVVALSATAPNVAEIAGWLGGLVGRRVAHTASDWRPVPLRFHVEERDDMGNPDNRAAWAVDLIDGKRLCDDGQVLVFTHTKADGRAFRKAWAAEDMGDCPFFHAGLRADERGRLARRFASGDVEVMCTTSSLSMGINLPARHVVLVGVKRGPSVLTGTEVLQSAGRAGRKGLDEHGDAWVLTNGRNLVLLEPEPVLSRLGERLEFHLVAEVDRGRVRTNDESAGWFMRSLYYYQRGGREDKRAAQQERVDALRDLVEIQALDRMDKHYRATRLGRCASRFYLCPRSVAGWRDNFLRLKSERCLGSDPELACAIADVVEFSSKRWGNYRALQRADGGLFDEVDPAWVPASPGAREAAWAAYLCLLGGSDRDIGPVLAGLRADAERLCAAWAMLLRGDVPERYWGLLAARLRYGVPWSIAGLTRLAGIGRMRALALADEGIETVAEFLRQRDAAREVVGEAVWRRAVASAAKLRAEGKL
jgi:replicative superfamily II helicase